MVVSDFMYWTTANDISIIGGLPTTFNDVPIADELIKRMEKFYFTNGHDFIVMENRSQYPRQHFYDTPYHLAEEYQINHSRLLAEIIKVKLDNH